MIRNTVSIIALTMLLFCGCGDEPSERSDKSEDTTRHYTTSLKSDRGIEELNKLANDQNTDTEADWILLYRIWFFETSPKIRGASWYGDLLMFGYDSPYSKDLLNSPSMGEIKTDFCKRTLSKSGTEKVGFSFTGPGSGKEDYYTIVEWFIGLYSASIDYKELEDCSYEVDIYVENVSGWRSGTRLPKTWQHKIKKITGCSISHFVDSAPRGETVRKKLGKLGISLPRGWKVPSFGGDFEQTFQMKDTWKCE